MERAWWRGSAPFRVAGTLAICASAGFAFSLARLPLPWMLGPLLVTGALRVGGVSLLAPPGARQGGQWIIGTALGLYFTPAVMREVASLWHLLLLGAAFAIGTGYASALLLARLAGIDRRTALFASVPGGAAEMSVLGEPFGARADLVAAAHSLRIVVVVVIVPAAYAALGVHGTHRYVSGAGSFAWPGFLALLGLTFAAGAIAQRLRVPNAFVLGPLAVGIPMTAAGIDLSTVPGPVSSAAQLLLGCALGMRFGPEFVEGAARFVACVVSTVLFVIALTVLLAFGLAIASGVPAATLVLGLAPGGIAEMCITAKVLELGVPLVTAFHVTRVIVLLLGTAPLFRIVQNVREMRKS